MPKKQIQLLIPIQHAIERYGRPGDARGGRAALAAKLDISSQAIGRWGGSYIPWHHAKKLLKKDHGLADLAVNKPVDDKNESN